MKKSNHVRFTVPLVAAGLALSATLSGCSVEEQPVIASPTASAFPTAIPAPEREAVLAAPPRRVAAVDVPSADIALALKADVVGAPTPGPSVPWFNTQLDGTNLDPLRYNENVDLAFPSLLGIFPDVILAAATIMSPATKDKYASLPMPVLYSEAITKTDWQTRTRTIAATLGLEGEGEELIERTKSDIADAARDYPALAGKTILVIDVNPEDLRQVTLYTPSSQRVQILNTAGLVNSPALANLGVTPDSPGTIEVPAEQASLLEADILVVNLPDEESAEFLGDDPLLAQIPAVQRGQGIAVENDKEVQTAFRMATPNSLSWATPLALAPIAEQAFLTDHPEMVRTPAATPAPGLETGG